VARVFLLLTFSQSYEMRLAVYDVYQTVHFPNSVMQTLNCMILVSFTATPYLLMLESYIDTYDSGINSHGIKITYQLNVSMSI